MRFIVDFYRYVVLAGIGLLIAGVVWIALELSSQGSETAQYLTGAWLGLGILIIVVWVMSLGMVATFISIHDRHAEIAEDLRALRYHLESRS